MDGNTSIKKQIPKIKPKLVSTQRITNSLPISLHVPYPCHEFALVVSGTGKLITETGMHEIEVGDLFISDKDIKRGIFFNGEGEIISLGISFKSEKPFPKQDITIFKTNHHYDTIKALFEITAKESQQRSFISRYLNENLVKAIILCAMRLFVPEEAFSNKNRVFTETKAYFDKYFLTLDNIDSVCRELNINKFFLTHLFKENLGKPPVKYLIDKRMEFAKKLLKESSKSISEVAKECGYVDVAYFCRIFKKTVGTTPLKYRRSDD